MTMPTKNAHCSFCGVRFPSDLPFPRLCGACGSMTYVNPLPVAVVLLPVDDGVLLIRRAIEPRKGQLAFPGGFINVGESWQQAGARELLEETGLHVTPDELQLFDVLSAPDGTVLIFSHAQPRQAALLPPWTLSDETEECVIAREVQRLAFPLHTQVMEAFFARRR